MSGDLVGALKLACAVLFVWHAAAVLAGWRSERASRLVLAAGIGLIWAAWAGIQIYMYVSMLPFDFSEVMAAIDDAQRTLVAVLGEHGVALTCGALAALCVTAAATAAATLRLLRFLCARLPQSRSAAILYLALAAGVVAADVLYAAREAALLGRAYRSFATLAYAIPDYAAVPVSSDDSVFILQLESVNADAVFIRAEGGAAHGARIRQPGLETVVREGEAVLFPLFWSNGPQTNRAWESILCGVSGNAGPPIADDPSRLGRRQCLPAKLRDAGYATIFLYAYFNLDFNNFGAFARSAGFRDIVYGDGLMRRDDPRFDWGYDDCAFYERAFDYLERRGLEHRQRLLAYFEVGTNHAPFTNSMKHPEAHPHRQPRAVLEHYQNAVAEQDHCLAVFWKRFRALRRDDIHLFILPDHGVVLPGARPDADGSFATWLAYVPPKRRAAEFKPRVVLSPRPSQAEMYPTILELLGAPPQARSFSFALRGEPPPPDYDDCRVLAQPGQRLIVYHGRERTEYPLGSRGDAGVLLARAADQAVSALSTCR